MARYVLPNDVHSPKRFWSLLSVLRDDGEGGSALALGRWGSKPVLAIRWNGVKVSPLGNPHVLAIRWNGVKVSPLGNPQSRGLPTWFVVPDRYVDAIISTLDAADLKLAPRWGSKPVLAIRWNGVKVSPLGNPQSRGLPTWFVVPDRYVDAIISTLDAADLKLAQNFLK